MITSQEYNNHNNVGVSSAEQRDCGGGITHMDGFIGTRIIYGGRLKCGSRWVLIGMSCCAEDIRLPFFCHGMFIKPKDGVYKWLVNNSLLLCNFMTAVAFTKWFWLLLYEHFMWNTERVKRWEMKMSKLLLTTLVTLFFLWPSLGERLAWIYSCTLFVACDGDEW